MIPATWYSCPSLWNSLTLSMNCFWGLASNERIWKKLWESTSEGRLQILWYLSRSLSLHLFLVHLKWKSCMLWAALWNAHVAMSWHVRQQSARARGLPTASHVLREAPAIATLVTPAGRLAGDPKQNAQLCCIWIPDSQKLWCDRALVFYVTNFQANLLCGNR